MAAEELIRARLAAAYPVQDILPDSRIFAGRAPQNVPAPFIVWRRISGSSEHVLDGATDLKAGRFQIDCYGQTYDQAWALGKAAADAMHGANDGDLHAELSMEIDLFEEEPPVKWRRVLDFMTMERI